MASRARVMASSGKQRAFSGLGRGSSGSAGKWKRSSRRALSPLSLPCTAFFVELVP